jgi:YgiT-type zinc finger domain-containing protein
MKCVHCSGTMERSTAPLHIDRGRCHITLDRVPAWVCQQCGEAYFEEKEVAAIQALTHSVEEQTRALEQTG